MKYFILTIALIIVSSFSRGNFQEDTLKVKDSIMPLAMDKTDKQFDSIFTSNTITFKDINDHFEGLTNHVDNLNASLIVMIQRIDSATIERDSALLLAVELKQKNKELAKENVKYSKTISLIKNAPHILMVFTVSLFSFLVGTGLVNGYRKWKNEG